MDQGVEAEHETRILLGTDEDPRNPPPEILAGAALQVGVELGHTAGESRAIVLPAERLDDQVHGP